MSYQVTYANFVMDQHQNIPEASQISSQLLGNNINLLQQASQQNSAIKFNRPVRTRISFSHQQQIILETEFKASAYVYRSRRIEIAKRLGIDEKHVKVWFQNRRMKWKRESLQNGKKVTMPHGSVICRSQYGTLKEPKIPGPIRKFKQENATKENILPVHKPMAAQLVKGVFLKSANVKKNFKPQLVVQMPVPMTITQNMQPSPSQICSTPNYASIQHYLGQQSSQPQQQLAQQEPQHHVQQRRIQQVLQQALEVQHKLQQQPPRVPHQLQHQPPQQHKIHFPEDTIIPQVPTLTFDARDVLASNPRPTEYNTLDDVLMVLEGLQNPECSEESVDLDTYLNALERRVEAQQSDELEARLKEKEQEKQKQTIGQFDYRSNLGVDQEALCPKTDDDFDMKDLLDNLDRYASYPGTAPDLDFNNCGPILEYDPTLPFVDFSFEDLTQVGH